MKKKDPEFTDLYTHNFIDTHYPNRAIELESLPLYDFASWFDIKNTEPKNKRNNQIRE